MIVHLPGPNGDKLDACIKALILILGIGFVVGVIGILFDLITGNCGAICRLLGY